MKAWDIDKALSRFLELDFSSYDPEKLSESDTRSKFIDQLLIGCMGWSEENISREEHCSESSTFLDYKLSTNIPMLIVEAKKSSIDFSLPKSTTQNEFKIGGVLSNCKVLLDAMVQARDYAISKGVTFCVVTNGLQYIFFRAMNQQGIEWTEHRAVVFRDHDDIANRFDLFSSLLSKSSVENGTLQTQLPVSSDAMAEARKYSTLDTRYLMTTRKKDRNPLFPYIGEIVRRTFQDLASNQAESEILEHCYVESPKKGDKKKPYLDLPTSQLSVSKKDAGDFQQRIISSLQASRNDRSEVILLLGSVGVGKSTFIQRFRKVLAKDEIDSNGIWVYLNFKHFSDTGVSLMLPQIHAHSIKQLSILQILPVTGSLSKSAFVADYKISLCNQRSPIVPLHAFDNHHDVFAPLSNCGRSFPLVHYHSNHPNGSCYTLTHV